MVVKRSEQIGLENGGYYHVISRFISMRATMCKRLCELRCENGY